MSTRWFLRGLMGCAFFLSLLSLLNLGPELQGQTTDSFRFEGLLLSREDSTAVAYAHVYVMDKDRFSIASPEGYFSIRLNVGDTLVCSAVGYQARIIRFTRRAKEGILGDTVWMQPVTYLLDPVLIYARNAMQGFSSHKRIDFDAYTPRRRPAPSVGLSTSPPTEGAGLAFEGVLTAIANAFNSEYKQLQRLHTLRQKEGMQRYYRYLRRQRMPDAWVVAHSYLLPHEVEDFLEFWKADLFFLEMASEYELLVALEEAQEKYIEHMKRVKSFRSYSHRVSTLELRELLDEERSDKESGRE